MNKNFELDSREAQLKKPTHEAKVSTAEFQGLDIAVSVVDARIKQAESNEYVGRTFIWPQSYLSRMDKFETQRQVVIAEALKARVIAVEQPGVGISDNAKAPFLQNLDLLRGSFKSSAYSMLGALNEIVPFKKNEEVELLLYSQGVAIGTSMLDSLGNEAYGLKLKIPRVTIIEAVNDQPWNLLNLKTAIDVEDKYTDRYLDENKKYEWLLTPDDRTEIGKVEREKLDKKQNTNLIISAVAMGKPFTPIMLDAIRRDNGENTTGISKARIDILKFDASGVSRLEKNCLTERQLKLVMPLGQVALTLLTAPNGQEGHHHPAIHSMPNVDVIARNLLD